MTTDISMSSLFLLFMCVVELVSLTKRFNVEPYNDEMKISQIHSRTKRTLHGRLCPTGCASCSSVNGCVACRKKYFLHIQRTGFREIGVCVTSCPIGHLGVKTVHFRYCTKCRVPNCDVCLYRRYCTRCQGAFYEYGGECRESCPHGLVPGNNSRECLPKVDCAVSEWGSWGVCAKDGRACGAKYGIQTRVRQIVQLPSSSGKMCPENTEDRVCVIDQPDCPALVMSNGSISKRHKQRNSKRRKLRKRRRRGRKRQKHKENVKNKQHQTTQQPNLWSSTEISNQIEV